MNPFDLETVRSRRKGRKEVFEGIQATLEWRGFVLQFGSIVQQRAKCYCRLDPQAHANEKE